MGGPKINFLKEVLLCIKFEGMKSKIMCNNFGAMQNAASHYCLCVMHKNHNPCMFIFQIIYLVTKLNAIFCPLCKLNIIKAIWLKLHTLLEHNETMCHMHKNHNSALDNFGVITLSSFAMLFFIRSIT